MKADTCFFLFSARPAAIGLEWLLLSEDRSRGRNWRIGILSLSTLNTSSCHISTAASWSASITIRGKTRISLCWASVFQLDGCSRKRLFFPKHPQPSSEDAGLHNLRRDSRELCYSVTPQLPFDLLEIHVFQHHHKHMNSWEKRFVKGHT